MQISTPELFRKQQEKSACEATEERLGQQPRAGIPPGLSLYLDLVRILAALSVVLYHTWDTLFPHLRVKWPAHEAVVFFFVLSGYVIAHAANRPDVTFAMYVQHRAARILPVTICAIVLGIAMSTFLNGGLFGEIAPASIDSGAFWWSTLANLFFVAHSFGFFFLSPFNTPLWSLNYEVWYYAVFATWLYTPRRWRVPAILLAVSLAGPKIMLLLPVWLSGVWLYNQMPVLQQRASYFIFFGTICVAASLTWLNVSDILRIQLYAAFPPAWRLHFSTQFLYDYIFCLVVTANFAAVTSIGKRFNILFYIEKPIRYFSGFTFSAYLFHMPLASLAWEGLGIRSPIIFYGFIALTVFFLAQLTEKRTGYYRKLLEVICQCRYGPRPH